MTAAELIPVVSAKLKDDGITDNERIMALGQTEQVILDYCHIPEVPCGLKYVWADMAVDLLRYQTAANAPAGAGETDSGAQTTGAVSSIKEGDTTVSFGGKSAESVDHDRALAAHQARLDELAMDYKAQLRRYRKVVW